MAILPDDPVGGCRLPWKSLIASSWTNVSFSSARCAECCRREGKDEGHKRAERDKAFHVYLSPQSDTRAILTLSECD